MHPSSVDRGGPRTIGPRNRRGFCFFVLLSTEEKKPAGKPDRGSNGCECPYVPETNNEAAVRSTIKPDAVGTPLTYESFTLYPICERAGQHCRAYEPRCPETRIVRLAPLRSVCLFSTPAKPYKLSRVYYTVFPFIFFFSSSSWFLFWLEMRGNFEIRYLLKLRVIKIDKKKKLIEIL